MPDMIDKNGNFRTLPIGTIGKRNISTYRLNLLRTFLDLILHTDMLNEETKIYITDKHISIKGVNEQINAENTTGKEIPYNTTAAKIAYDRQKIERLIGESFIRDLVLYTNNAAVISVYEGKLLQAMEKYGAHDSKGIREAIALDLDKRLICKEIDDDKFYEFIRNILPYLKTQMKAVADSLDRESVGYFNYLLMSPVLNDNDKQRLNYISRLINGSDTDHDALEVG